MLKSLLSVLLYIYKSAISPFLPPSCRYYPSCSDYAKEAVHIHGAVCGSYLAFLRVLRCHPFHDGGYDPVPLTLHVTANKEDE